MAKRIVFDFDGVINSYTSGWMGATILPDPPTSGIDSLIQRLRCTDYEVCVQSSRCATLEGKQAVIAYLDLYGIVVDEVTAEKRPAICYIDDRGITFNGNTDHLFEQIVNFKAWWEK